MVVSDCYYYGNAGERVREDFYIYILLLLFKVNKLQSTIMKLSHYSYSFFHSLSSDITPVPHFTLFHLNYHTKINC